MSKYKQSSTINILRLGKEVIGSHFSIMVSAIFHLLERGVVFGGKGGV